MFNFLSQQHIYARQDLQIRMQQNRLKATPDIKIQLSNTFVIQRINMYFLYMNKCTNEFQKIYTIYFIYNFIKKLN